MVVFDSSGYSRICRLNTACRPISRISRLTTVARTGRRMKISVKAIACGLLVRTHGRRVERDAVIDDDRRTRPQFELPRGDDDLARLQPLENLDAIAARFADAHEAPFDCQGGRCRH